MVRSHGWPWFGGYGPDGTGQFFESIGLRPGKRNAMIAGASEAGGGALLAAGLMTPVAGTLITAVMSQAIRSLKLDKARSRRTGAGSSRRCWRRRH